MKLFDTADTKPQQQPQQPQQEERLIKARSYDEMTFDELLARKVRIETEIKRREQKEVESVINKVRALTEALGVSVASLFGIPEAPTAAKVKKERKKRGANKPKMAPLKNGADNVTGFPSS